MSIWGRWVCVAMVAMLGGMAVATGLGQASPQFGATPLQDPSIQLGHSRTSAEEPILTRDMQRNQEKRQQQQREQQVLSDTAKLLQLATNLKAEVDKGNQQPLPEAAIKDADEIGKLAKRVSDRIKAQ